MSLPDAASSQDPEGQVESVDAVNDPDANVDNNVIAQGDENIHEDKTQEESAEGPTLPKGTPPTTPLSMPNLADLTLHSPSSMIVGTPFSDAHSTRFEYPFPAEKASSSSSPELPSHTPPQTSPTFSSLSSSPSSSVLVSASQPQLALSSPPILQHFAASFPPPSELPSYSPTHPKMRAVDPPVPPALVKRRQRFTLGLSLEKLSRRLSLRGGSASMGTTSPGTLDADPIHRRTGEQRAGPSSTATLSPTPQEDSSTEKGGGPDDPGTYT
ncbi:hypothetical protein MSAN_00701400 [Mycena sanguinolenta]|uniref:Uncharacterized protein n=1 Tax=Mycena sanguinolenta TaxID=230812 RepID=A0A8H6Z513_9AGAR|nr:hypothetical protein MSAN_00701400 [Mycena sanguinolenta]